MIMNVPDAGSAKVHRLPHRIGVSWRVTRDWTCHGKVVVVVVVLIVVVGVVGV